MKKSLLSASIIASLTLATSTTFIAKANQGTQINSQLDKNVDVEEHVLVTANRSQQDRFSALSSNVVITQYEIEAMQVTSVGDILKRVAGIYVANQGDSGQISSIFTRGTNSNHTLVIIDGVRVNSATTGATNLSAISVQQIDRIEVVKGPRAALWGSDAIGGVIQIFTKQYQQGNGYVSAGFGSNDYYQASASLGLGNEDHNYTVNVSTEKSDGFNAYTTDPDNPYDIDEPDDDGYKRESISLIGKSVLSNEFSVNLVGRYEKTFSEFDSAYGGFPSLNEQNADNYHIKAGSLYRTQDFSLAFSLAKSQDQGARFGNGIKERDAEALTTKRDQASLVGHYSLAKLTGLTAGVDWYQEEVSANYDLSAWDEGHQQYDQKSREVQAVFLQLNHQENDWLFEAATRYDDIENLGNKTTYNLSVGYQLANNWLISFNRGTGFKAPTFNDLYWPGSGNPELAPEHSLTHEILLRNQASNYTFELSVFDTDVDDLIAWNSAAYRSENIEKATMKGADANVTLNLGNFSHSLGLAYVDAKNVSQNVKLARRPEWNANYAINYQLEDWQLGTVLSYRGESEEAVYGAGNVKLSSYWLADITAVYQVTNNVTINAKVANLFDKKYQSALNYISDGVNYRLSVSYIF
ncbi:TonB-dependent receptor domain-containing protein [Thalassotalea piscium]|uniref:Vitamin B12 transporter n=1 Tax=Thalassotalea piscium TaxID=1230533 RepID=A0A7X0NK78_9GAMM|nr:TonB-dependent receptor [Thalassotalea piscium]MBB6544987.1 vitamin B12 transporter [Thalassotalea piscium]